MSDDNSQPEAPQAKSGRNPIERMVVWGGILLLVAVVGFEFFAQKNYNAALNWLVDNDNAAESAVDEALAGAAIGEKVDVTDDAQREAGETTTYEKTYKWASLFKDYTVFAEFDETEDKTLLAGYETALDRAEFEKGPQLESVKGVNTVRDGSAEAPVADGE